MTSAFAAVKELKAFAKLTKSLPFSISKYFTFHIFHISHFYTFIHFLQVHFIQFLVVTLLN